MTYEWRPYDKVSIDKYIDIQYGSNCTECEHHRTQHVCTTPYASVRDEQSLIFLGCNYCSCKKFKELTPLERAVLIEKEYE